MQLTLPQKRVLEYLEGKKDVPTSEVGESVYGKFFGSPFLQISAAKRVLKELHSLDLLVKHFSYSHNCDVWSIKNAST